jgi:hypothetical protein
MSASVEYWDVVVVGAGIMGATIGEAFRKKVGLKVQIIDDHDPLSGSRPSGGCVKPSKLTGLGNDDFEEAMALMAELYGAEDVRFAIKPSGGFVKVNTRQLDMEKVFGVKHVHAKVHKILDDPEDLPAVVYDLPGGTVISEANMLVVAAGMGCAKMFPEVFPDNTLTAKQGVSFQFEGEVDEPYVETWAPYKQVTVHNVQTAGGTTRIWASDGSALIPKNWTDERTFQCLERVTKSLRKAGYDVDEPVAIHTGLRPFHKAKPKPCFLEEVSPDIWVATGAGKFGCISAGWAAVQLLKDYNA